MAIAPGCTSLKPSALTINTMRYNIGVWVKIIGQNDHIADAKHPQPAIFDSLISRY
jgi:hypothetical protein